MSAHSPKFALVKWVNGEDRGKFSIVSSSWLKGFDVQSYAKNKEETFVVEWRDQKKAPLGGWACFDAIIIKISVSDSKSMLEKQITNMVSLASPTLVKEVKGTQESTQMKPSAEQKKGFPELVGLSDFDDSDIDKTYSPSPGAEKRSESEEAVTPAKFGKLSSVGKTSSIVRKNMFVSLEDEIKMLRKENAELKRRLVEEIPAMMQKMDDVIRSKAPPSMSNLSEGHPQSNKPGRVEILPGTGVFVDVEAWLSAKSCNTPGAIVGRLLVNLFDKETLLSSNLKGGASKLTPNAVKKSKLDEVKISALRGIHQQQRR